MRFVEDLLERLRDLIIVAAVPEGAASVLRGVPEDQLERMRGQQSRFGPGALTRAADIVNAGLTEMTGATAPRMQLELICARILLPAASGPSGYAARLDRLERRLDLGGVPTPARSPAEESAPEPPSRTAAPAAPSGAVRAADKPGKPSATSPPTSAPGRRETSASAPVATGSGQVTEDGADTGGSPPAPDRRADGSRLDTAALRRVWPDVLARIFTMRRVTWTFLSQHAQVVDYDGNRLVLGIATAGLTNTFRAGNHAELVRQALIDEIGVDVPVEGVPMSEAGRAVGSSAGRPGREGGSDSSRPAAATPAPWPEPEPWPEPPPESGREPAVGADHELPDRERANHELVAPEPVESASMASAAPDDSVSDDDEDIASSASDGRAVVERVLGGRFLGEMED